MNAADTDCLQYGKFRTAFLRTFWIKYDVISS